MKEKLLPVLRYCFLFFCKLYNDSIDTRRKTQPHIFSGVLNISGTNFETIAQLVQKFIRKRRNSSLYVYR